MNKLLVGLLCLVSLVAGADQRFETVGGFCHFVINPDNDDNEVFFANCMNSITQNNDGTGDGSTWVTMKYPWGGLPIDGSMEADSDTWGDIPCVMVDSNGTTYVSNDWYATYKVWKRRVTYRIVCSNGQQQ